ncbi:MAG: HAD-IC family P-type ATPase [Deltaproteobacteria bacterium]|nr:HAD-IC family P-type ATPase [Deltaproteobacteria bacterium]
MDISNLLKAVILNAKSRDHGAVLDEMTSLLLPGGPPESKAVCDLKNHESLEGVLSGSKSAIFHCLSEEVSDPAIALAVSKKGITDSSGKHPTHIFFLLISPIKESGTHLQLLSKLEGMLLDKEFQKVVLGAQTEEEVRKAIKKIEGSARSIYIPLPKDEVFTELDTTEAGLSDEDALKRLKLTGINSLQKIQKSTLLKDFIYNLFFNLFAVLLWAGGFMSFIAGMPELGWAIFLVIIINAAFSFWQEYKAESAVEALKKLLPRKVRVIRAGSEKEIDAEFLVPGDLIMLSEGDSIPSDGRLVEAQELRVDNSTLTGESKPVYKISEPVSDGKGFIWTEIPNLVFAGTTVVSGSGRMVVTATGMDTEIGRVAYLTQAIKPEESPLQKELTRITKTVTAIAVSLGLIFFFLGYRFAGLTFAESFIFAIGIIVANVPEGLLPTVSLSLAMGVQRMAAKKAIVKKLSAVETLGSATVICTDKTGTLTTNQMCVTTLFVNGRRIEITGSGYAPQGEFLLSGKPLSKDEVLKHGIGRLLEAAALCNNASLHPPAKEKNYWTISGDPTEAALITAAEKSGLKMESLNERFPRVAHLPFERIRKRMATINEDEKKEITGGKIAFVKGSPKEVLELCTRISVDGRVKHIEEGEREELLRENDILASKGLRILAAAYREVKEGEKYQAQQIEKDLVFLGLIAMLDPPRPEVKKAVADCHSAGIKVIMVTGDYGLTAKAIAEEADIAPKGRVISGEEINAISHRELREILKGGEVIFSRVAPNDKLRVVTALQDNGEVVAVTGDGVNDAPALKKADIGVAMGLRGSDVAKESAEIVLADDNFASIVDAIREGRAVYSNIKKFVVYIFASNIPEIIPFIGFVIFKIPLPLTVMQILAVDLGTDVFPALGLGVEPPEKGIMEQPPRPKGKKLLDFRTLSRAYLFLGPIEAVLSMGGFFFAYWLRGWAGGPMESTGAIYAAATTMTFAGIVTAQVGNVFACRTEHESILTVGLLRNRFVLMSLFVEISLMLILIYTPFLQKVFGFAPLTLNDWAFLSFFPIVILLADEARKYFLRKRNNPKKP